MAGPRPHVPLRDPAKVLLAQSRLGFVAVLGLGLPGCLGYEYTVEQHAMGLVHDRTGNELDMGAAVGHRIGIVDTSGIVLAGAAGAANRQLARSKAVGDWARGGGGSGTIEYSYAVPAAVPGLRTSVSYFWAGDTVTAKESPAVSFASTTGASNQVSGLDFETQFLGGAFGPGKRLSWAIGMDTYWYRYKLTVAKGPETEKDPFFWNENRHARAVDMVGAFVRVPLAFMVFPSLRLMVTPGWDPFYGFLAAVGLGNGQQWHVAGRVDWFPTDWLAIAAKVDSIHGSESHDENLRRVSDLVFGLSAGIYAF